jgi:hypothetical protein
VEAVLAESHSVLVQGLDDALLVLRPRPQVTAAARLTVG